MPEQKVWFITGVSRGLGRSIALAALKTGARVIGTTRNGQSDISSPFFSVTALDVTNETKVTEAIQETAKHYGRLDVVINNAGYSVLGAVEEISLQQARDQFETCFFGPLAVMRACLPIMRKQKNGHIINISSVAGMTPMPSGSVYGSSKFALEGVSEGLALEVEPFGINITIVEPGAFRTDFLTENSMRVVAPIEDYKEATGKFVGKFRDMNGHQRGDPEKAAQRIVEIAGQSKPPLHLILGADAYERIEKKLNGRIDEMRRLETITKSTDY